jgi:putative copper export protein
MTEDRHARLLEVIEKAKRRSSDRLIIKTMRFAVWGLGAIMVLFVTYILATLYIGAHDNKRVDELEHRIEKLERR